MTNRLLATALLAAIGLAPVTGRAQGGGSVVRLDPAFDAIVSPGTVVETLQEGFGFINGIAWVREGTGGHLLVSDIPANRIYKWTAGTPMTAFLEQPDWRNVVEARPPNVRFGANGIAIDREGRLVYAAEADRAVMRIEKDGRRTVLADRYEGKRLNSPNDVVVRSDGSIYFTDPSGGGRFGTWDLKKELAYQGVFLLRDGKLRLVVHDLERPNGLLLSPDEKQLYVNDSVKRVIMRYDLQGDGTVANGRLFADMNTAKAGGNPDGMRFDERGNLYSVGPGGIWVINPQGRQIGLIVPPENAPGFTFGDPDRKSIYMAASSKLARVRLNVAGAR
jgi:gluconolactonase